MADDDIENPASPPPPRERPWLLPYNRRLRHLQGITIRNLTLEPAAAIRPRAIDDDGVPSTLKSPAKALALKESRQLAHSRSSSDLTTSDTAIRNDDLLPENISPKRTMRPPARAMRRRSTIGLVGATPQVRQLKMEDITGRRMADTFFSLHIADQAEPVYVSEVVEKAMNPNFRWFDIGSCGPHVTRLDTLTVKVWARNKDTDGWHYLVELTVRLRTLQFIGKTLDSFRQALPPNCILFHMTDGIYTSFTDLPVLARMQPTALAPPKEHPDGRILKTSTYDALMRLATLDDCIQDALATRDRLASDLEKILDENREALYTIESVPEAQDRLKTVQAAVAAEKRRVDAARRKREELQANLDFRKERMEAGRQYQVQVEREIAELRKEHDETKASAEKTAEEIAGQRRRICEDLSKIFPMEPVPGKPLLFTIRGLVLPNSDFEDADEDSVSAALGMVAQLVSLLSAYLSVSLPYPVTPFGSRTTIDDPLSMSVTTKGQATSPTYPLFMSGVVRFRFDYGVFLLNKDIEILSNALGLRPLELRHTLPNLKYLLYIATAGKGELPARRAGGIKGLLRRDGALLSRSGSVDSTATTSSAGVPELKDRLKEVARKAEQGKVNGTLTFHKQRVGLVTGSRLREVG